MDLSKHVVLVVEDERALATVISRKLELSGFLVQTASSVDAALLILNKQPKISAIWLDHYLIGEKNGLDLMAQVKANPKWKNIPFYVVSNTASDDKVRSYVKFGVKKYYVKADHSLNQIVSEIVAEINRQEKE